MRSLCTLAAVVLLGACSNSSTVIVSATVDATRSTVSAAPDSGVVADGQQTSTITVKLVNSAGAPLAGVQVQLSASGSANVLVQPAKSDANGLATGTLASTVAETKTVSALVIDGPQLTQTAQVQFVAGAAAGLSFSAQPATTAAGATLAPVEVSIEDAAGNVDTGSTATVTLSLSSAAGTLSGTLSQAAVAGVATFSDLSVDLAGTGDLLSAASTGLTGATSAPFDVIAGSPSAAGSSLTASPSTFAVGGSSALVLRVADALGNPIADQAVTLTASGSDSALSTSASSSGASTVSGVTDLSGLFEAQLTATAPQSETVAATLADGTALATAQLEVVAGSPDAAHSSLVATASVTPVPDDGASTYTLTATARDAYGDLLPGQQVSLGSSVPGDLFVPTYLGSTDLNGVFTTGLAASSVGPRTLTAQIGGALVYSSVTFGPSSNASLTGLSLSAGALSPAFAPGTTSYSAAVGDSSSALTVTPTAAGPGASLVVQVGSGPGFPVASGATSTSLPLVIGANTVDVQVTAQDGVTTLVYSIVVTRACAATSECTGGLACVSGACGACSSGAQCLTAQACIGGACGACTANSDCDSGEVCSQGGCYPPPVTCASLLAGNSSATDGVYTLQVPGSQPFQAYCDMLDGGWQLLLKIAGSDLEFAYASAHWTTADTLSADDLTLDIRNAKYDAFNLIPLVQVWAHFPSISTVPNAPTQGPSTWDMYGAVTGGQTALQNFNNEQLLWQSPNNGLTNQSSNAPPDPSADVFYPGWIYESGWQSYGYNDVQCLNYGDNVDITRYVRWGFCMNNESSDPGSSDCGAGVGVGGGTRVISAGNWLDTAYFGAQPNNGVDPTPVLLWGKSAPSCATDADCTQGQTCNAGFCG